jgi:hypothetical protein
LSRVQADIEKASLGFTFSKCFTMVVLPAPDGAEKMMIFPCIGGYTVS